jgi:hypothetical protein
MMVAMTPVRAGSDRDHSRPLSGSLPFLIPRFPGGNLEVCLCEIRVTRGAASSGASASRDELLGPRR